jgi:formiminotetrahydrofolate cyclodeaminase
MTRGRDIGLGSGGTSPVDPGLPPDCRVKARPASEQKPATVETLERYLDQLGSANPTPGGGSAAALVAAAGAALVEMVARISLQSARYAAYADLSRGVLAAAERLRAQLLSARERDEQAFERVVLAQGLPRGTEPEKQARARALESALHDAAAAPLDLCELAIEVMRLARQIGEIPNRNLASDVGCAAEFGDAALRACAYNVRVNHRFMNDPAAIAAQAQLLQGYESEGASILSRVRRAVGEALTRTPPSP